MKGQSKRGSKKGFIYFDINVSGREQNYGTASPHVTSVAPEAVRTASGSGNRALPPRPTHGTFISNIKLLIKAFRGPKRPVNVSEEFTEHDASWAPHSHLLTNCIRIQRVER